MPFEEAVCTESSCGTIYALTTPSLDTTSPSGYSSSFQLMADDDAANPAIPVLVSIVRGYYIPARGQTMFYAQSTPHVVGSNSYGLPCIYSVAQGDAIISRPTHVSAVEDDCDGVVDELDEVVAEDTLNASTTAGLVGAGIVRIMIRRGVSLVDGHEDDAPVVLAACEMDVRAIDGTLVGGARGARFEGETGLLLSLVDPLHPAHDLAMPLHFDEEGRFGAIIAARGNRYALEGRRTGMVQVECLLQRLDEAQANAWTVGSRAQRLGD